MLSGSNQCIGAGRVQRKNSIVWKIISGWCTSCSTLRDVGHTTGQYERNTFYFRWAWHHRSAVPQGKLGTNALNEMVLCLTSWPSLCCYAYVKTFKCHTQPLNWKLLQRLRYCRSCSHVNQGQLLWKGGCPDDWLLTHACAQNSQI